MLAAALPFIGGFGVGGCAYALRLQNDCFVWLRAPFPPRALAVAALAFGGLRCALFAGLLRLVCAQRRVYFFCKPFNLFFLPAPLDTRLSLCYNHRRSDRVRLDRFHFITNRRGLSSPVYLFFSALRVARPPDHPVFGLVEGGRGVCLAVALCCVGRLSAAPRSRLAFGAGRLRWFFCRRLSLDYTPPCQGS